MPNPHIEDFTTGGTNNPGRPNGPNKQGLGWGYQLLPYLEQGAVQGLVKQEQLQATEVSLFFCPSRRSPEKVEGIEGSTVLTDYAAAQPLSDVCPNTGSGVKYDITKTYPFKGRPSQDEIYSSFWCTNNGPLLIDDAVFDGVIVRTPWQITQAATPTAPAGQGALQLPVCHQARQNKRRPEQYARNQRKASPQRPVGGQHYPEGQWIVLRRSRLDRRLGPRHRTLHGIPADQRQRPRDLLQFRRKYSKILHGRQSRRAVLRLGPSQRHQRGVCRWIRSPNPIRRRRQRIQRPRHTQWRGKCRSESVVNCRQPF